MNSKTQFTMMRLQRCLLVALSLFLLASHPSSAMQFSQPSVSQKLQQTGHSLSTRGGVRGHLSTLSQQGVNRSDTVAHAVANSAARLKFLSGGTMLDGAGSPVTTLDDAGSPVSAVPGGYAMTIKVGTPAQTFIAIADTGSDLVWVQCKPCKSCFTQPDPLFDPSKSSTYSTIPCSNQFCQDLPMQSSCSSASSDAVCNYEYGYGDQSTTDGQLSSETITLGQTAIPKCTFGCGTENQGTFQSVDGLVGLGLGPLSLPSQLGSTVGHKFSYCLVASDSTQSSPIVFGELAVPSASGLVYTPLVSNSQYPSFYYVTLNDISVGDTPLNIPSSTFGIDPFTGLGGIIFDSGTTITQLAQAGYDALQKGLQAAITYPSADGSQAGLDTCFDVRGVQDPTFPTVTFNFDSADFVLPMENTFVAIDESGDTVCLYMAGGDLGLSIFGNTQQQNFEVIYDIENSQLGWVSSQC